MTDQIIELQEQLQSGNIEVFDTLAQHYDAAKDWRSMIELCNAHYNDLDGTVDWLIMARRLEGIAGELSNAREKGEALVALGDFYARVIGNRDEAMKAYQASFRSYPDDTTCLENARAEYLKDRDYSRALKVYELELKHTVDERKKGNLLLRVAQLKGDLLRDFEGAIDAIQQVVQCDFEETFIKQLRENYSRRSTCQDAVKGWLQQADGFVMAGKKLDKASALFIKAALFESNRDRGDLTTALEYASRALKASPDNTRASQLVDRLQRALSDTSSNRSEKDNDGIAAVAPVNIAENGDDERLSSPEQLSYYGDLDAARDALVENPIDLDALREVRRLLIESEQWDVLLEQLEQSVRFLRKKDGELEVMVNLANLLWRYFENFERAEHYYKRIKLLDNSHPDIFPFYKDFYAYQAEWRKLFALLSAHQQNCDDLEQKRVITQDMATLAAEQLESAEKAMEVWRGYLRQHPDDMVARLHLRKHYEDADKHRELFEFLFEEVRLLEAMDADTASQRIETLEYMLHIADKQPGQVGNRADVLKCLVVLDPFHSTAQAELIDYYQDNGQWNSLVELHEHIFTNALNHSDDSTYTTHLLALCELLCDQLDDSNRARIFLEDALNIVPGDSRVVDMLIDVYTRQNDMMALFELKNSQLDLCDDIDELEVRLREQIRLAQDVLNDTALARPLLEKLASIYPEDPGIQYALIDAYRELEEWSQLVCLLDQQARVEPDIEKVESLLVEAAQLSDERLENHEQAAKLWQRVLDIRPHNAIALEKITAAHVALFNFEEIERLYRNYERFEELYDLFDAIAGTISEQEAKREIYSRMAAIASDDIKDAERVIISLEELLSLDDDKAPIYRRLIVSYQDINDLEREYTAREALNDHISDTQEVIDNYQGVIAIEQQRENYVSAFHWRLKLFALANPTTTQLNETFELAQQLDKISEYVKSLEDILTNADDPTALAVVREHVAKIYWQHLNARDSAIDLFESLINDFPQRTEYLVTLAELYEGHSGGDKYLDTLERLLAIKRTQRDDIDAIVDLLVRIGQWNYEQLATYDRAMECFQEALELDSTCMNALRGLRMVAVQNDDWERAVELLSQEILLEADDSLRIDCHLLAATIYREQLAQSQQSLQHLQAVLSVDEADERAVEQLFLMLDDDEISSSVCDVLEPLAREAGRDELLYRVLETRLNHASSSDERKSLVREIALLARVCVADKSTVLSKVCAWFSASPEDLDARDLAEQLAGETNSWKMIEEVFASQSSLAGKNIEMPEDLLFRIARIREECLGETDTLIAVWQKLFDFLPGDNEVQNKLESLYREGERYDLLVDLLVIKATYIIDEEESASLIYEAGSLADTTLSDLILAQDLYEKSLTYQPGFEKAANALENIYISTQQWIELEQLYASQAPHAITQQKWREWTLKQAQIRFEYLDDSEGAFGLIQSELLEDTDWDEAVYLLKDIHGELQKGDVQPHLRIAIASILEPIYRRREDFENLLDVLLQLSHIEASPTDKAARIDEVVYLLDNHLGRQSQAFEHLLNAVVIEPYNSMRREKCELLGQELGRLDAVVKSYHSIIERGVDDNLTLVLLKTIGQIEANHLMRVDAAATAYQNALAIQPDNRELLHALESIYEATQSYDMLADNLSQQLTYADSSQIPELLRRLGEIEENHLRRLPEAIEIYRELLALEPYETSAVDSLERLYEQSGQWDELAALLNQKSSQLIDAEERVETLLKLAQINEGQRADIEKTIGAYEAILDVDSVHRVALQELHRLYPITQQWSSLVDVLQKKRLNLDGTQVNIRNALEIELAQLFHDKLSSTHEAIALYRGVLERTPHHSDALTALESFSTQPQWLDEVAKDLIAYYTDNELWLKLIGIYERLKDSCIHHDEKAAWLGRIARLRRHQLEDFDGAMRALASAWKLCPEHTLYHDELLAVAGQCQAWESLADSYSDMLSIMESQNSRLELLMQLGDIYYHQLERLADADGCYREVIDNDPAHQGAFQALEQLFIETSDWPELIALYSRRLELGESLGLDDRIQYLSKMARVYEEHLEDIFSAINIYEELRVLAPDYKENYEPLCRLYRYNEQWIELADVLEARLKLGFEDSSVEIETMMQLGAVYQEFLYHYDQAIELYSGVLRLDSEYQPAIDALEAILARDSEESVRAADILEPIYRRQRKWTELLDVLDRRAIEQEMQQDQEDILHQVARIAEFELEDSQRALDNYARIFLKNPHHENVRLSLHRLCIQTDNWQWLADQYRQVFESFDGLSNELRMTLLIENARIYEERLNDLSMANHFYQEALVLRSDNEIVVDAIERVLMRQKSWRQLAEFFEQRLRGDASEHEQRVLLERLAILYEGFLDDIESAIETYKRLLDKDPTKRSIQQSLERLFADGSKWDDLVHLYGQQASFAADPAHRLEYQLRQGQILERELKDIHAAFDIYVDIFAAFPGHFDVLRHIEGLRHDLSRHPDEWHAFGFRINTTLIEQYDESVFWQRIAELLLEQLQFLSTREEKSSVLMEHAQLLLRSSNESVDHSHALESMAYAFCYTPFDDTIKATFEALAGRNKGWKRVLPILLGCLESEENLESQVYLLQYVADIMIEYVNDVESAALVLQQVIDLDSENDVALATLQSIYEELSLPESTVEIIEKRLALVFDELERSDLIAKSARIYYDLGKHDEAIEKYEALMESADAKIEDAEVLAHLYRSMQRYDDLERILLQITELVDDDKIISVWRMIAVIQEDKLHKYQDAIASYQQITALDENDVEVVQALSRLFEHTEQWSDLIESLVLEKEFADNIDSLNQIELKIARIFAEYLHSPADSFSHLQLVLQRDPEHEMARQGMMTLLALPEMRDDVAVFLEKLFEERDEWNALENLYQEQLNLEHEPTQRASIYEQLANLYEQRINNSLRAFVSWSRAFLEMPDSDDARTQMERLSGELKNHDELAAIYEDALETATLLPPTEKAIRRSLAEIYVEELDDRKAAADHLEIISRNYPDELELLHKLDHLYQADQRWEQLADVLERMLILLEANTATVVRYRLAYLQEVVFDSPEYSLELYRQVLLDEPLHEGAIQGLERLLSDDNFRLEIFELLEPIYQEHGEYSKLLTIYETWRRDVDDALISQELTLKAASIARDELHDTSRAFYYFLEAFGDMPDDKEIESQLEAMATTPKLMQLLIDRFNEIIATSDNPSRVIELLTKSAKLAVYELEDHEQAHRYLHAILDFENDNRLALELLEKLIRTKGDMEALADVLHSQSLVEDDAQRRIEILLELAQVRTQLERHDQAIAAYREILDLEPGNLQTFQSLIELLEAKEYYPELIEMLEHLGNFVESDQSRVHLFVRIGRYCSVFLNDSQRAIDAYARAMELAPDDMTINTELQRLYRDAGMWKDLIYVIEQEIHHAESVSEQVNAYIKAAEVYHDELQEIEPAINAYQQALSLGMTKDSTALHTIFHRLHKLYTTTSRFHDALELCDDYLKLLPEEATNERVDIWVQIAQLCDGELNDKARADKYWNMIVEVQPNNIDAIDRLIGMHKMREEWHDVMDLITRKLEYLTDDREVIDALMERAAVSYKHFAKENAATIDYLKVLDKAPLHEEATDELIMIMTKHRRYREIYELSAKQVDFCDDAAKKLCIYNRMATVAKEHLLDAELHLRALEQASALAPEDLDISEQLVECYRERGDIENAQRMITNIIDMLSQHRRLKDTVRFHHLAGKLAEQQNDVDLAQKSYETAHRIDATYIPNLFAYGKLMYTQQKWNEALKLFQTLLLHQMSIKDSDQKVALYYYLGNIRYALGDSRRARDMFQRALSVDPEHEASQKALQRV